MNIVQLDLTLERAHARRHAVLVAHFLNSATELLAPGGAVHLTLCGTQPQRWQAHEHAARLGLALAHERPPWRARRRWPPEPPRL